MRRVLRYLRIAFSATCLIACVLLIALWMRSYSCLDALKAKPPEPQLSASSANGKLVFERSAAPWRDWDAVYPWELTSEDVNERTYLSPLKSEPQYSRLNICFSHIEGMQRSLLNQTFQYDYSYLVVPYYYPIALTALVAGIIWIPWSLKFSLRTLLIATTLIAGGLGAYVWLRDLRPTTESPAPQEVQRTMIRVPIDPQLPEPTTSSFLKPTNGTLSDGLNPGP